VVEIVFQETPEVTEMESIKEEVNPRLLIIVPNPVPQQKTVVTPKPHSSPTHYQSHGLVQKVVQISCHHREIENSCHRMISGA
jgi:hypothetical protein